MQDQGTYLIDDNGEDTVGIMNGPVAEVGDVITVQLNDENGMIIFKRGAVKEVLNYE